MNVSLVLSLFKILSYAELVHPAYFTFLSVCLFCLCLLMFDLILATPYTGFGAKGLKICGQARETGVALQCSGLTHFER